MEQVLDLGRHILMEPRRINQSEEVASSHWSREAGTENTTDGFLTRAPSGECSIGRTRKLILPPSPLSRADVSAGKITLISAAPERGLRGRIARPLWTLSAGS